VWTSRRSGPAPVHRGDKSVPQHVGVRPVDAHDGGCGEVA
jgi:hypothetical protein